MGLFDRFPWVNTHDLNLDWIIQKMKEWGSATDGQVAKAETAASSAKSSETNAAASVSEASRIEAVVEGYAQDCNSASASARASATAAAQSAQEAASSRFAYGNFDRGFAYKTLDSVDSRTGNNKEYLNSPTFFSEEMVRVAGSGGVLWGTNMGQSNVNYHYEKIYLLDTRNQTYFIDITSDVSGKHLKPYRIECVALIEDVDPGQETLTNAPYISHVASGLSLVDSSICYYASNNHLQISTNGQDYEYLYIRVYFTESGLG